MPLWGWVLLMAGVGFLVAIIFLWWLSGWAGGNKS